MNYNEAKQTGELVKKSRSKIIFHKTEIERKRKNLAWTNQLDNHNRSNDTEQKWQNVHDEETGDRKAIEKDKSSYNESFQRLCKLKVSIEHSQKLIEKGSGKIQTDFDTWYGILCDEKGEESYGNDDEQIAVPMVATEDMKNEPVRNVGISSFNLEKHVLLQTPTKIDEGEDGFQFPPGIRIT